MQSSLIQVRVDDTLKVAAGNVFNQLGLDMPSAIRMFLKRTVQENGIPFSMKLPTPAVPSDILAAMQAMSVAAKEAGVADMTLDEINAEIDACRNGR